MLDKLKERYFHFRNLFLFLIMIISSMLNHSLGQDLKLISYNIRYDNPKDGLNTVRLDFSGSDKPELQPGMYFCKLNSKDGTITGKFIVR